MSHIILICSDKEFNVSKLNFNNFNIEICDYSLYCEFENIINKKYVYEVYIDYNKNSFYEFKKFISENIYKNEQIDILSLWFGGDYSKHIVSMPKFKNIKDYGFVEEEIDYYYENNYKLKYYYVNAECFDINHFYDLMNKYGISITIKKYNKKTLI